MTRGKDVVLLIKSFTPSEKISLGLAVLSVILGAFAIVQAIFYKMEQDRQAKIQDAFLRGQRINMSFSGIRSREIYRSLFNNGQIVLRKDRAIIFATSSFHNSIIDRNSEIIEELLREVLKKCYTDGIMEAIKKHNVRQGDIIGTVNLRSEYDINGMVKLLKVNERLEKYGLYMSILIE